MAPSFQDRRQFLQASSIAVTSAAIALSSPRFVAANGLQEGEDKQIAAAQIKTGWIDAHVHVWTPDTTKYPLDAKYQVADMVPKSFMPSELFEQSKPHGVDRIVLIQMSFYGYDNRYMLDCIAQHPETFSGVAIVDEKQDNLSETMAQLRVGGVRGFRLYANKKNVTDWLGNTKQQKIWELAAKHDMAICLLADPDALPGIDQLCQKHSSTNVVIDHYARIGMSGVVEKQDLENLSKLSSHKHTFLKTSAFYALGKKKAPYTDLAEMTKRLVESYGVERLMWGSDCPYQVVDGHNYADSINLVLEKLSFLTEKEKQHLLRDTAASVFFKA